MTSGIYCIVLVEKDRFYIGSAVDIDRRWKEHKRALYRGGHSNPRLQHAWNKYGADAFDFRVLEEVGDLTLLVIVEQRYIDSLKPFFNIAPRAGSMLGYRFTPEQRVGCRTRMIGNKIRLGKPHPVETLIRYSEQRKGRRLSPEHKAKLSAAGMGRTAYNKGKPHSPEHKAKMSARMKALGIKPPSSTGRRLSPEHIAKIRAFMKVRAPVKHTEAGKKRIGEAARQRLLGTHLSDETRQKLSEKLKGHPGTQLSEEARSKISEKMQGNKNSLNKWASPEKRAKQSAAMKAVWARRKVEQHEQKEA